MEYTSLIFPGDKIDIFASGLSDNSTSYKSSFSDKLTDSMWEITMPVDSGRVVLFQLGTQFDFIIYTQNKTILKSSAIVRQRYRKENMYFLAMQGCKPVTDSFDFFQTWDLVYKEQDRRCIALCSALKRLQERIAHHS